MKRSYHFDIIDVVEAKNLLRLFRTALHFFCDAALPSSAATLAAPSTRNTAALHRSLAVIAITKRQPAPLSHRFAFDYCNQQILLIFCRTAVNLRIVNSASQPKVPDRISPPYFHVYTCVTLSFSTSSGASPTTPLNVRPACSNLPPKTDPVRSVFESGSTSPANALARRDIAHQLDCSRHEPRATRHHEDTRAETLTTPVRC